MFRSTRAISEVSASEAHQLVEGGAHLLDVREVMEFAQGHAAGAHNLPLSELPSRHDELDRGRRIAVICRSGNRSAMAVQFLQRLGFDAVNVGGGMGAWQRAGLPTGDDARVR